MSFDLQKPQELPMQSIELQTGPLADLDIQEQPGGGVFCFLFHNDVESLVVIMDTPQNKNASVTNSIEHIAKYLNVLWGVFISEARWIEVDSIQKVDEVIFYNNGQVGWTFFEDRSVAALERYVLDNFGSELPVHLSQKQKYISHSM